ncbi:MAG: hypothetical protein IMZ53_05385 [Thermoplasmata archaeon]|nr:hypothetical protein [Thermoplasmata archaeon]
MNELNNLSDIDLLSGYSQAGFDTDIANSDLYEKELMRRLNQRLEYESILIQQFSVEEKEVVNEALRRRFQDINKTVDVKTPFGISGD